MSEQFFFTCAIGPVQGFIATARTSQDLWFGSWMLSELSKAAAKVLEEAGYTLIFPAPTSKSDLRPGSAINVANKVVAIVNGAPSKIGKEVQQAIEKRLDELAKKSFDQVKEGFDRPLAEAQVEDLIEFYWAASPFDENNAKDSYKQARARADALLKARKSTRNFRQVHKKEDRPSRPKSSLDGFRESVLPIARKDIPYWVFKADKGEMLSGIDLMKRWGKRTGEKFISTTDVAAIPFIESLDARIGQTKRSEFQERVRKLLAKYTNSIETPGTMFYVDRLTQLVDDDKNPEDFRADYAKLRDEYGIKGEPSSYYALLQADGDNMGKTIDALEEQDSHRKLSKALSAFAPKAKAIIKNNQGVPVYVGGDDVLAYLPLHTALECITALNNKFDELIGNEFSSTQDGETKRPTLSAGLAIVHHLTPLSDALEQARNAEKAAKQIPGKHGLAVSLNKRSGAERRVSGRLDKLSKRMETLIRFIRDNAISRGVAYELDDLHRRMQNSKLPAEALEKEALRILKRKRESGGGKEIDKKTKEKFEKWFEDENLTIDELAAELILAAEIANAKPKKEKTDEHLAD